ncbi:hypothetical protein GCK72_014961 [Caenorhabditis remanei]|nr:hypothetical protein GCK72_014961 [Caenorhabditis remanei]KAF1758503.1 hypothetical protein GCK72_014961 [Caenorhabditis remanei]
MHRSLLLLLAISTLSATAWDHFQFDITLFCNFQDRAKYNLKIEWYEVDSVFSGEDRITTPQLLEPNTGRFSFSMPGAMNGDEALSNGYKPKAYISHDCTDDGKRVDLDLTVVKLCNTENTCHYRIIQDITNRSGSAEIEASGFKEGDMSPFPDFP